MGNVLEETFRESSIVKLVIVSKSFTFSGKNETQLVKGKRVH